MRPVDHQRRMTYRTKKKKSESEVLNLIHETHFQENNFKPCSTFSLQSVMNSSPAGKSFLCAVHLCVVYILTKTRMSHQEPDDLKSWCNQTQFTFINNKMCVPFYLPGTAAELIVIWGCFTGRTQESRTLNLCCFRLLIYFNFSQWEKRTWLF